MKSHDLPKGKYSFLVTLLYSLKMKNPRNGVDFMAFVNLHKVQ